MFSGVRKGKVIYLFFCINTTCYCHSSAFKYIVYVYISRSDIDYTAHNMLRLCLLCDFVSRYICPDDSHLLFFIIIFAYIALVLEVIPRFTYLLQQWAIIPLILTLLLVLAYPALLKLYARMSVDDMIDIPL